MKIRTAQQIISMLAISVWLVACGTKTGQTPVANNSTAKLSEQSVNAVIWYATSAENAYIYEQTYAYAAERLQLLIGQKRTDKPAAVILDIDETVLDNSPYMLDLVKKGQTFSEESWAKWVRLETARPLPGVKGFIALCNDLGVEVFFVSNRSVKHLEPTITNLQKVGIEADLDHVLLKEKTSDKTERRAMVTANYEVVLLIGDNLRDFDEMFKDRSTNGGREVVRASKDDMLARYILLPNPMYGQWERIFSFPEGATEAEKAATKIEQTNLNDY